MDPSGSYLFKSEDAGRTWRFENRIAFDNEKRDVSYVEPALALTPGGKLLAFHRTFKLADRLVTCRSNDYGSSWSEPKVWDQIKGHPHHPLMLKDGRIFLSYGYRHKPYGIRARLIDCEKECEAGNELVIRDDGPCGDLGYPWACELPNGRVLVVYYFCDQMGLRHIAASLIEL